MDHLVQSFRVAFEYKVYFTSGLFDVSNILLRRFLEEKRGDQTEQKILFVIDRGVLEAHPGLQQDIITYFDNFPLVKLAAAFVVIPGGEAAKNDPAFFDQIVEAVHRYGIDRHSYIAAIGGGAVLDVAGYASAVSHRGIRHIRIPTTVLSQNDSGIGVKNGINHGGKKNFLGTFAPPAAVFNDDHFLTTLDQRNWRSGIAEAIKVALIKDGAFFEWIEKQTGALCGRDPVVMNELIRRCAILHLQHISGGDPFELGSSRPLDFGHWSAHKLEQLTGFSLLHGEAVALGIALDTVYSTLCGYLPAEKEERIIGVLSALGFAITHPLLQPENAGSPVLAGLQEFREHLGGRLTIMLLTDIGQGLEVHSMDPSLLMEAAQKLKTYRC